MSQTRTFGVTFLFGLLIQAAGMGSGLLSSRVLGPEGKGELVTVVLWANALLYMGVLGLPEATTYFAAKERGRRPTVIATSQWLAVIVGALVTLIGWLVLSVVLSHRGEILDLTRAFWLLFAVPGFISLVSAAALQGSGRWGWFNLSRSAVHLVTLALMLVLWFGGVRSVTAFAMAYLAGNVAPAIIALAGICASLEWSWRPSFALAKSMLAYGAKVQVGVWSAMANARVDQMLLSVFFPAAALGVYAVAVTYAAGVNLLAVTFAQIVLPGLIAAEESGTGREALARVFRWNLWLSGLLMLILMAASPWLLPWLFGRDFAPAVPITNVLLLAGLAVGSNMVLSCGCKAFAQPALASQAEAVGLVVTASLLVAFLPLWGAMGAAVASLGASCATTGFLLWSVSRHFRVVPATLIVPQ